MTIDTGYYYKLSNQELGDEFALESSDPGNRPRMTPWRGQPQAGQLWRLTPRNNYYQLSTLLTSQAYALEGGAPNKGAVTNTFGFYTGQLWKLEPQGNNWYRLTNKFMEQDYDNRYALNGGAENAGSLLTEWNNKNGQLWKLTANRPTLANNPVPSLAGGGEGPVSSTAVSGTGTLKIHVVFVDFDSVHGTADQITQLKAKLNGGNKLVEAFNEQSYGKLTVELSWGSGWRRLPKPLTDYAPVGAKWNWELFIRDAVGLVSNSNEYQIVAAAVPNTDKFIHSSGAHQVTIGTLLREINFCDVTYTEHYTTMMHEMGHCLGLPDLYPYQSPYVHKVGPWDVMGDIVYATGFLNWERNLFGWLDAERVTCVKPGDVWNGAIAPPSAKYGTCMVVVRPDNGTGDASTLYVVQVAPSVIGRDGTVLSKEAAGLLIYKVVSQVSGDDKPLEVISNKTVDRNNSSKSLITAAPFEQGNQIDRSELPFTVNVAKRTGDAYYIDLHVK